MNEEMTRLMQVLQFTDSTFPVGTFSFSNGLETAAEMRIVHDAPTLEAFTRAAALQAAFSDGVAAAHAYRSSAEGDYDGVRRADAALEGFKMNAESRLMLARMGKKLAELGVRLFPEAELLARWLADINAGSSPGLYPVAQGIVFAHGGLTQRDLYCSHQYGVINMILSAALRLVRVSHYDTQAILLRLCRQSLQWADEAERLPLDQMHAFVPQIDICASLHEKGAMRMFMN